MFHQDTAVKHDFFFNSYLQKIYKKTFLYRKRKQEEMTGLRSKEKERLKNKVYFEAKEQRI